MTIKPAEPHLELQDSDPNLNFYTAIYRMRMDADGTN